MKTLMITLFSFLATTTQALAATGLREDNSGIFVWVFLGFCSLIVLMQMVPAFILGSSMLRAAISSTKEQTVKNS
jgi:hypothetical protein